MNSSVMTSRRALHQEIKRVFGSSLVDPDPAGEEVVRVLVKGWPYWERYFLQPMLEALSRWDDNHGRSRSGSREIRQTFAELGAFIEVVAPEKPSPSCHNGSSRP